MRTVMRFQSHLLLRRSIKLIRVDSQGIRVRARAIAPRPWAVLVAERRMNEGAPRIAMYALPASGGPEKEAEQESAGIAEMSAAESLRE